jgi:hypothetical protein
VSSLLRLFHTLHILTNATLTGTFAGGINAREPSLWLNIYCPRETRVHLGGPNKHPVEYLEHFHWAVESEDSLIEQAIKRWAPSVFSSALTIQ